MVSWLKLAHIGHSGKLRPHEHTSYLPLGAVLLVVGLVLCVYTAGAASPGPESGSIGLTGTVPGKPPTIAATISQPVSGQRFSATPITVSGTCPATTLVEVFKNDIFAGSSTCSDRGTYSLEIDLLVGENKLMARVYDALNQPGPDSNTVTVFYDALGPQGSPLSSLSFGGQQMMLNTDAVFRGAFPDKEMTIPIDILGGRAPYAININWGDGTNKVVPRSDNATFRTGHTYKRPGTYQIMLQGTDADGRVAFLSVAAIVNGQPALGSATGSTTSDPGFLTRLLLLWPLYTAVVAVVISFWLGEVREKRVLRDRGQLIMPSPSGGVNYR